MTRPAPSHTIFHGATLMNTVRNIALLLLAAVLLVPCLAFAGADKAPKKTSGEEMIQISLGSNAHSGKTWRYAAGGKGRVSEVKFEDYAVWQETQMKPSANGTIRIPDGPIPGTTAFTFKGEKPGTVELRFTYADKDNPKAKPERTAVCTIKVHADKTLSVISLSEKDIK